MLAGALYKFSSNNLISSFMQIIVMGIIPVAPFDWVGLISSKIPMEHSQVVGMGQWEESKKHELRLMH